MESVDTLPMTDDEHMAKFTQFISSLSDVCICEINEFRLQLLIKMVGLTGLTCKGQHVADRAYPAKGKG
jgi:hypothetical protein